MDDRRFQFIRQDANKYPRTVLVGMVVAAFLLSFVVSGLMNLAGGTPFPAAFLRVNALVEGSITAGTAAIVIHLFRKR